MALSRTAVVLAASTVVVALATAASVAIFSPARAQTATPACTCSAPIEVVTSTLPTSPRAWMTHCQCGAQSCAVLNGQVLQCSK